MQWDNIQLNASGSAANNPFWLRGTFNGGKAEQKGVEMNGAWQVTPSFKFEASAFFADPEFSEETIYPDGGLAIPAGTVMPISPERKYWAAVEYTLPNFMDLDGRPVDPASVQLPVRGLEEHRRHRGLGGRRRRPRTRRTRANCCSRRTRPRRCSSASRPTPAGRRR